ncbi:MAG: hypothetical protein KJ077_14820 [Anaerolineae bacterium]|nr:hypothetical protein [Anaerolineae bacterium]
MWEQALEVKAGRGQARSAWYKSELQFRGLLEKLPAGAYTCDTQGLITYFNRHAVQLWGRAPKLNDPVDRFCGSFKLFAADGTPLTHDQCWMALALRTGQEYNGDEIVNARLYEVEQQARAEAEAAQQRLALLAEMRERNRLAQELHDTVAQALGYLNLKIGMMSISLNSGEVDTARANLQELKQVIGETYTDVREEIFNLRAKVMSGMSFMEVLDRYITKYRRFYNLDIALIQEADPALFEFPPEVITQLIRTIQEALINVRKHTQVSRATIRLGQEAGYIWIIIEDEGQGFDLEQAKEKTSSFGLQIMRERVESVGGSLEVNTAPGQGTRIILRYAL